MKFWQSLQFRLSALVFLFGAVLIGIGVGGQLRRDVERQFKELEAEAAAASARLAGLTQHALRRGLPSVVDLELSYVAARRGLSLGLVAGKGDNIMHVTDRKWLGKPLTELPIAGALPAATRARSTMSTVVIDDNPDLLVISPFLKGPNMRDRGVVVLAYVKSDILAKSRLRAMEEALRFSAFLLGACLLLWLALNAMVTERVNEVVRQTNRAAVDDTVPEPLPGWDEFAMMSRAFCSSLQMRQALWLSQQPLWRMVESLRDVFWSVSLTGNRDWYVNAAFERVWGVKPQHLKEDRFAWLRPLDKPDRRRVLRALQELSQGKATDELRLRVSTPSGARRVLCRSFPVLSPGGEVHSIAGLVIDITEVHEVNRRLAQVAEQERRRLGWDLHDDLCQRLVGIQFQSNMLMSSLKQDGISEERVEQLKRIGAEVAATAQLARNLARGLAPVMEGGGGIDTALDELALFLKSSFGARCDTAVDPRLPPLQPEAATHLCRIAQELSTNAVKHGGARHLEILLWRQDSSLELRITSDGKPFDGVTPPPEPASDLSPGKRRSGMGMHMIRQRLDILGAQIRFRRATGPDQQQNLVVCEVPLTEILADLPAPPPEERAQESLPV
jgi:PAS domain S-box-containing protein